MCFNGPYRFEARCLRGLTDRLGTLAGTEVHDIGKRQSEFHLWFLILISGAPILPHVFRIHSTEPRLIKFPWFDLVGLGGLRAAWFGHCPGGDDSGHHAE